MKDNLEDKTVSVNTEADDADFVIEVVENPVPNEIPLDEDYDNPEAEAEEEEVQEETEQEEEYELDPSSPAFKLLGKRAQKRIKELLDERNGAQERASRAEAEAAQYKTQVSSASDQTLALQEQRVAGVEREIEANVARLQSQWEATDVDDRKALFKLQQEIAKEEARRLDVNRAKQWIDQRKAEAKQAPRGAPAPDTDYTAFTQRNGKWFQKDRKMTTFAMGVHQDLIGAGYRPDQPGGSRGREAYYAEIEKQVREAFPQEFKGKQAPPKRKVGV